MKTTQKDENCLIIYGMDSRKASKRLKKGVNLCFAADFLEWVVKMDDFLMQFK